MPNLRSTHRVLQKRINCYLSCLVLMMLAAGVEFAQAAATDGQGGIHFKTQTYATSAGMTVLITVMRDDSQNDASIHYATSDGTAVTDVDYTPTSGDLVFPAGQAAAYFWVSTLTRYTGDTADKTVMLNLSDPSSSAVLSSPATAQLTIYDRHVSMREYFPLSNGSDWQYLANGVFPFECQIPFETVGVNQVKTHTLFCPLDGYKQNFTSDAQGIRLHRLYFPKLTIRQASRKVSMNAIPPITLSDANAEIGQSFNSTGEFRTSASGLGFMSLSYFATYTLHGYDTVTVPIGTFEVIKLEGTIDIYFPNSATVTIAQTYYLAKGVGIVKRETHDPAMAITFDLVGTNAMTHDMAVTGIVPPAKVALSASKSTLTKTVKVNIQNRGPLTETIADVDSLQGLVRLDIESLGVCPAPDVQLQTAALQKRMPINLKPKQSLSVEFAVTFNCANDLTANKATNLGHEDFRYRAAVDYSAMDGAADVHPADDSCPRSVKLPYMLDEYPDGKIKDYGCGAKKPDKTFGAAVITDVTKP